MAVNQGNEVITMNAQDASGKPVKIEITGKGFQQLATAGNGAVTVMGDARAPGC